jgi:rhodanese-related sulfurtransferase
MTTSLRIVASVLLLLASGGSPVGSTNALGEFAQSWVQEGAILLDVRTPEEFAAGHLRGAVNVPVDEVAARLPELGERVVVYCCSGLRTERAAAVLQAAGLEVLELGTLEAWGREGDVVRPA